MIIAVHENAIICYKWSRYVLTLYCRYNDLRVNNINRTMFNPCDPPKLDIICEYTNMVGTSHHQHFLLKRSSHLPIQPVFGSKNSSRNLSLYRRKQDKQKDWLGLHYFRLTRSHQKVPGDRQNKQSIHGGNVRDSRFASLCYKPRADHKYLSVYR